MKLMSLTSGSKGNVSVLETAQSTFLVDCGASAKFIEQGLKSANFSLPEAILLTHEHMDHIKGLGVWLRRYQIPTYLTEGTYRSLLEDGRLGQIDLGLLQVVRAGQEFQLGRTKIYPFAISHDAQEPVGYRFEEGDRTIALATDIGCIEGELIEVLSDLDGLLLEANHEERLLDFSRYPYALKERIRGRKGHLSNDDSGKLLAQIAGKRLKQVLLGHLSEENNRADLAVMTVMRHLKAVDHSDQLRVETASANRNSRIIEV